jgi:hypothetical protein
MVMLTQALVLLLQLLPPQERPRGRSRRENGHVGHQQTGFGSSEQRARAVLALLLSSSSLSALA